MHTKPFIQTLIESHIYGTSFGRVGVLDVAPCKAGQICGQLIGKLFEEIFMSFIENNIISKYSKNAKIFPIRRKGHFEKKTC